MNRLALTICRFKSPLQRTLSSRAKSDTTNISSSKLDLIKLSSGVKCNWLEDGLRIDVNNAALKELVPLAQELVSTASYSKETSTDQETPEVEIEANWEQKHVQMQEKDISILDRIDEADLKLKDLDAQIAAYYESFPAFKNKATLRDDEQTHDSQKLALQKLLQEGIKICDRIFYHLEREYLSFNRSSNSLKIEKRIPELEQKMGDYVVKIYSYKAGLKDLEPPVKKVIFLDDNEAPFVDDKDLEEEKPPVKPILEEINEADKKLERMSYVDEFYSELAHSFRKTVGHLIADDAAGKHVHNYVLWKLVSTRKEGVEICKDLLEKLFLKHCAVRSNLVQNTSSIDAKERRAMEQEIADLKRKMKIYYAKLSWFKFSLDHSEFYFREFQKDLEPYPLKRQTTSKGDGNYINKYELFETIEEDYRKQITALQIDQLKISAVLQRAPSKSVEQKDVLDFAQRQKELVQYVADQAQQQLLRAKLECFQHYLQLDKSGFSNCENEKSYFHGDVVEDEVYASRQVASKYQVE